MVEGLGARVRGLALWGNVGRLLLSPFKLPKHTPVASTRPAFKPHSLKFVRGLNPKPSPEIRTVDLYKPKAANPRPSAIASTCRSRIGWFQVGVPGG